MRHYYSAQQIRDAEAPLLAALPDGALMRRAAWPLSVAIAAELRRRTGGVAGRRVCAVVGSGDNGGDALWAATFLRRRGAAADAILLNPERTHAEALTAFRAAGGREVQTISATTDLVIDGVVGISGAGPLRPAAAAVFADDVAPVVAVDIPSGVDVATGAVTGPAVRAAVTVTFGGLKPVHGLADCGRVELVDIGLDLPSTDLLGFEAADGAAVAAHSGMVRYVGSAAAEVVSHWPEVIAVADFTDAGRAQAWVVGPGFGTGHAESATLRAVLTTDLPVIVDADALTILANHLDLVRSRQAPTVLT